MACFRMGKWLGVRDLLQSGGTCLFQKKIDERGRRDFFQFGLVVENEAVVENRQGDGFDVVESDGWAAVQQGGRSCCFRKCDGRTR